jgi:hypothetical protein
LKPKGYLKSTTASAGKKYQPKVAQVNTKVLVEKLTREENFKQTPSAEVSTSKPKVISKDPEVIIPKVKIEIDSNDIPSNHNKKTSSLPVVATTMSTSSLPEVKVSTLQNPEEHISYPDSPSTRFSYLYASYESEETNPHFPFPPLLYFSSPNNLFLEFPSPHPEEVERSPVRSLKVF